MKHLSRAFMLAVLLGGAYVVAMTPPPTPAPPFNLPNPLDADGRLCWGLLATLAVIPVFCRIRFGSWPAMPEDRSVLIPYGMMLGLWIAVCLTIFRVLTGPGEPLPPAGEWIAL